jgi:hypothetical protein
LRRISRGIAATIDVGRIQNLDRQERSGFGSDRADHTFDFDLMHSVH